MNPTEKYIDEVLKEMQRNNLVSLGTDGKYRLTKEGREFCEKMIANGKLAN